MQNMILSIYLAAQANPLKHGHGHQIRHRHGYVETDKNLRK